MDQIQRTEQKTNDLKLIAGCLLVITGLFGAGAMIQVLSLLIEHSSSVINMMMSGVVVACITGLLFKFVNKISIRDYALLITLLIVLIAFISIIVLSLKQLDNDLIPLVLTLIAVAITILVNMLVFSYFSNRAIHENSRLIAMLGSFFLAALMNYNIFAAMSRSTFDPVSDVLRWIYFTGNAVIFAGIIMGILTGILLIHSTLLFSLKGTGDAK